MDTYRQSLEEQVIRYYMGGDKSFAFGDLATSKPYLRIAAKTNNEKFYILRMDLQDFPNRLPCVYVETMLSDCHGNPMNSASKLNHTLKLHPNGWTQICHYRPDDWTPNQSLWLIYIRCVLWLNIYEQTLISGHDMEYYLRKSVVDNSEI